MEVENQYVQIVEASGVVNMLKNALSNEGYGVWGIDQPHIEKVNEDKTIFQGSIEFIDENGYKNIMEFEMNVGTHKDEIYILDEIEVVFEII